MLKSLKLVLSWIYSSVSKLFNFLYDHQILKSYQPKIPTVIVGNITWGGTGKTPVVMSIVSYFESKGLKVGIVSRSYKGQIEKPTLVDVKKRNASEWGDEAYLMATKFPRALVVVGQRKVDSVKWLEANSDCQVIIIDDGLQHRAVAGQFYITLLDTSQKIPNYQIAPLGTMREHWGALSRTSLIVLTKINLAKDDTLSFLRDKIGQLPSLELSYKVGEIKDLDGKVHLKDPFAQNFGLVSNHVISVSGIGNPKSFEEMLEDFLQHKIFSRYTFEDHHIYESQEIKQIEKKANEENAVIYTTSKDAIKIKELTRSQAWREVELVTEIKGVETLYARLDEVLRKHSI